MKRLELYMIIVSFSVCLPVFAELTPEPNKPKKYKDRPHPAEIFAKMDSNSDEKISLEEFKTPREKMFSRMDQNGDKSVTLDEMKTARNKMREKRQENMEKRREQGDKMMKNRFKEMDSDGNGSLTAEEARKGMFSRLDGNKDGFLTKEELKPPRHRPGSRSGGMDGEHEH